MERTAALSDEEKTFLRVLEKVTGTTIPEVERILQVQYHKESCPPFGKWKEAHQQFGFVASLDHITELGLSGKFLKKPLNTLPESIGDLKYLRKLHLQENPIRTLPLSMKTLSSLEEVFFTPSLTELSDTMVEVLDALNKSGCVIIRFDQSEANFHEWDYKWSREVALGKVKKYPHSFEGGQSFVNLRDEDYAVLKELEALFGRSIPVLNASSPVEMKEISRSRFILTYSIHHLGFFYDNEGHITTLGLCHSYNEYNEYTYPPQTRLRTLTPKPLKSLPKLILSLNSLKSIDLTGNNIETFLPMIIRLEEKGCKICKKSEEIRKERYDNVWLFKEEADFLEEISTGIGSRSRYEQWQDVDSIPWRPRNVPKLTTKPLQIMSQQDYGQYLERTKYNVGTRRLEEGTVVVADNITMLGLRSMGVHDLPLSIANLKQVIFIDLSDNQLVSLPQALRSLTTLQFLELENNKITHLPPWIGELNSLRELRLEGNNLSSLPEEIGKLQFLSLLDLRSNALTSLPDSICNLKSLRHLFLYGNQLKSLPENIGNLLRDSK